MKLLPFLLFFVLLASCSESPKISANQDQKNTETKKFQIQSSEKDDSEEKSLQYQQTREQKTKDGDTVFIVRDVTKEYYHTIYIDQTRNSSYNKVQKNPKIPKTLQKSIDKTHSSSAGKNKTTSFGLAKFWAPVYQYKKQYYLYDPCDGISDFNYLLTNQELVSLFFDGPIIRSITSSKKISDAHYSFKTSSEYGSEEVHIYVIDKKLNIYLFECIENGESIYQLYAPTDKADQFDVIVNDCRTQKEMELDFDEIDYKTLIKNIK